MVSRRPRSHALQYLRDEVLDDIAASFGLGTVRSARLAVGTAGDAFALADRGATAAKVVLRCEHRTAFVKRVPWYVSDAGLELGLGLAEVARRNGVPVPEVLRSTAGLRFCTVGSERFVVSEFLPAGSYDGSDGALQAVARTLGGLHRAARTLPLAGTVTCNPRSTVEQHLELLEDVESVPMPAALRDVLPLLPARCSESLVVVHGDFIPWNLGFSPGGTVMAVYDFDNASEDVRLHDLAEALVACFALRFRGRNARLREPGFHLGDDPEAMGRFLSAYEESSWPLSAGEREDLWLHALANLWECLLLARVRREIDDDSLGLPPTHIEAIHDWCARALEHC